MMESSSGGLSIQVNGSPEGAVSATVDENATLSRHLPGFDSGAEMREGSTDWDTSLQIANDPQGSVDENAGVPSHLRHCSENSITIMSLPIEIRDMIMESIFGGRKVHVRFATISSQNKRFRSDNDWTQHWPRYTFCSEEGIPEPLQSLMFFGRPDGCNRARKHCIYSPYLGTETPRFVETSLSSVLLVCKQWSKECLETFYKTNIFSFEDQTSFHIFISRLSSARSAFLRKIELIAEDDNDALVSLIARQSLAAPPYFWRLGENDLSVSPKLASITDVEIALSVKGLRSRGADWDFVRAHRVSHINRWLRYVFGGLRAVRSIRRMELHIECQDKRPFRTKKNRWSDDELDQATLDSIIDEFKREVLNNAGGLT